MTLDRNFKYRVFCENAKKCYGDKIVLGNIDLAVREGEFVTMVGPSGCGKSTFLRLLLGSEQPDFGTVLIDGEPKIRPNRDCGIVYQKYSLFPHLTILQNVALGPILEKSGILERSVPIFGKYRQKKKEYLEMASDYLRKCGLEDIGKYPYQLSGGMQQRVAIAQALIMHPKVLLLDEPFSALDSWNREQLQIFLLDIWRREKMTIIFVTHDLKEAIWLGTRIVVVAQYYETGLGKGVGSRIIADLPIPEATSRPSDFRNSKEFNDILGCVSEIAFQKDSADRCHHIGDLLLRHPDSFHTAPDEEWKRN